MKKIIASIATAIVLGVIVMLIPVMAYTRFFVTTSDSGESEDVLSPARQVGNNSKSASAEKLGKSTQIYGEEERGPPLASLSKLEEAAQIYGRLDAGPSPFPLSLFHAVFVVTTGLIVALGVSLYIRRKAKLS